MLTLLPFSGVGNALVCTACFLNYLQSFENRFLALLQFFDTWRCFEILCFELIFSASELVVFNVRIF